MADHIVEPFWMVYGDGKSAPTHKHNNPHAATQEAKRLAAEVPGTRFYVLCTVGCALKVDVEFRSIDPQDLPW